MRLAREWNGKLHVVTVGEDGVIRWSDGEWRSLSEVARAITGTRWSGPAFFGLKARKVAASRAVRSSAPPSSACSRLWRQAPSTPNLRVGAFPLIFLLQKSMKV